MTDKIKSEDFIKAFGSGVCAKVENIPMKLEVKTMTRLIDADALKEQFSEIVGEYIVSEIISIIDNAPTVEYTFEEAFQKTVCDNKLYCPSRPKGEWEEPFEMNGKSYHKCTHCHISTELILISNFCPNCGADMRGEK